MRAQQQTSSMDENNNNHNDETNSSSNFIKRLPSFPLFAFTGLGRVCTGCPVASSLLKVDSGYVSREECDRGYGNVGMVNAEQHLCAVTSSAGSCNGDSGGPMFDESYRQVGIVSFGSSKGCATGIPDVYTRVSTYIDWYVHFTISLVGIRRMRVQPN